MTLCLTKRPVFREKKIPFCELSWTFFSNNKRKFDKRIATISVQLTKVGTGLMKYLLEQTTRRSSL